MDFLQLPAKFNKFIARGLQLLTLQLLHLADFTVTLYLLRCLLTSFHVATATTHPTKYQQEILLQRRSLWDLSLSIYFLPKEETNLKFPLFTWDQKQTTRCLLSGIKLTSLSPNQMIFHPAHLAKSTYSSELSLGHLLIRELAQRCRCSQRTGRVSSKVKAHRSWVHHERVRR